MKRFLILVSFVGAIAALLAAPAAAAIECEAGSYDSGSGCTPAEPGSYVPEAGASAAIPCPVGTYSAGEGAVACTRAPAGSFVDTVGASAATLCPLGKYSDIAGAVSCIPAPAGSFVDTVGAFAATLCPLGTYSEFAGAIACTEASVGFYVDSLGSKSQTACPAGTTTLATASSSETACIPSGPTDDDDDGDGVANSGDLCPATTLGDPPAGLKKNRFAANAAGVFVDGNGTPSGFTVVDTYGCNEDQIVAMAHLGKGLARFGLTRGVMNAFIHSHA